MYVMDNNKKFILYKRVSTRRGQDSRMRIRDLKIYCERRRWKVVGEYVDLKVARQG
jgi:DNA invertase Pin-like site-specific DNA recombinase